MDSDNGVLIADGTAAIIRAAAKGGGVLQLGNSTSTTGSERREGMGNQTVMKGNPAGPPTPASSRAVRPAGVRVEKFGYKTGGEGHQDIITS